MTSIIKLNILSGAMDESPPCYILQIDDARILLDCGWDEHFDQDFMKELSNHVKHIDVVLLTYPDPSHLGALPYLVGKCGLSCQIFSTIPVYKMGQMFMYDLYQSRYNNEDFTTFNLDDVDAAFDQITQLKYNQTVSLRGKCHGISIVPIPAGHMIGGTIWKISKMGEEDIVYAVDYNHKKERHLNGCHFEQIQRPSLLITNPSNSTFHQERRRIRDEKLMTSILQALSRKGNVLIAVDTAGRVLELAHMLDQLWGNKNSGLQNHFLCFLNNVSYNVIEFAKSQIEWMSDKLMETFESARSNPFHFKYIRPCHSLADIYKISACKVVLASMSDLECGFARNICCEWISDPANSIILTSKTSKGTLARELLDWSSQMATNQLQVTIKRREKLTGEELVNYYKFHRHDSPGNDSSDSDDVQVVGDIRKNHDLVVKLEKNKTKKSRYSINRSYPIFPFEEIKRKYDDYGEVIIVSDYMKEVKEQNCNEKMEEEGIDIIEHPTKCVSYEKKLDIKAAIQFIGFEGLSDGESVQKIIANAHPRSVILVRAPPKETNALADYLRQFNDINIFTPSKGETIDTTTEAHIYQLRLTDGLVSSLQLQPGGNINVELAWVDGEIVTCSRSYDSEDNKNQYIEVDEQTVLGENNNTIEPSTLLVLDRLQEDSEINPHSTVFVNEIKFSVLKQIIQKSGVDCVFLGGILLCSNGTISVRRENKRKILIEGVISEDYFKVRSAVYSQYAIL